MRWIMGMRGGAVMGGGGRGYGRMMRAGVLDVEPGHKADARTIRRVAGSFRPYWRQVLVVLLAIVLTSTLGVVNPIMLKLAITLGFGERRFDLLTIIVAVMIAVPI